MSVSSAVILDTRRMKKKTSKYPVKLRTTCEREVQHYPTVYDLTTEEYNSLSAPCISDKLKKIRDDLKLIQRNAEDVASSLQPFSFGEFEKDYILDNSFFHQRKSFKIPIVPVTC